MAINTDLQMVLHLNSMVPSGRVAAKLFAFPVQNELVRNLPTFFSLIAFWFLRDRPEQRARMLAGLLGVTLATGLSVAIQAHLSVHLHPSIDPALVLRGHGTDLVNEAFDRTNSFPSDTATFYFALSTVLFIESRTVGLIAFAWSLYTAGFLRIALGWHYPSDVLAGIALGVLLVYLASRARFLQTALQRLLERFDKQAYIVHAALFLFLADAYSFFPGLQGFVRGFGMLSKAILKR